MGIIDHGKLLEEEESLKELEAKNAKFIHFCVSDAQKAAKIIAATFHSKDFRLTDANNLYLYDMTLPVERINRSFVESGIEIQEVHLCEDTLEDYFKKITGGEGLLNLIRCEFWKLKRKMFVQLVLAASFLFPIPLTAIIYYLNTAQNKYATKAAAFDALWQSVIGFGMLLLLPCILGIVAALLFLWSEITTPLKTYGQFR